MKFIQYYLDCLSHASYLIGDETTGRAVVVDPQRDVSEYLADAKELGFTIELVIETHFHADFLSGHLELAKATGAKIVYSLGRRARVRVHRCRRRRALLPGRGDARVPAHPRAHPGVAVHRGLRARRRLGAVWRADRRHAVHRRCGPS